MSSSSESKETTPLLRSVVDAATNKNQLAPAAATTDRSGLPPAGLSNTGEIGGVGIHRDYDLEKGGDDDGKR